MKNLNLLSLVAFLLTSISLSAQFDDLYYVDQDDSDFSYEMNDKNYHDAAYADVDSEDYDYYTEYDDYYTARIRRFSRPAGFNYYSSYNTNNVFYDPFYSYYAPSYAVFDRNNRTYGYSPNRNSTRSFITYNYGNPYYGRGFTPWGFNTYGNYGLSAGGNLGGYGGFSRNAGCPVGGFSGLSNGRATTSGTTTRPTGTYYGSRRSGSTRTSTGSRATRVQTYKSNSGSNPAPRSTSGSRRAHTRSGSSSRSNNSYKSRSSSNWKSSFRNSSSMSRSSRSGGTSRSIGSSRRRN